MDGIYHVDIINRQFDKYFAKQMNQKYISHTDVKISTFLEKNEEMRLEKEKICKTFFHPASIIIIMIISRGSTCIKIFYQNESLLCTTPNGDTAENTCEGEIFAKS